MRTVFQIIETETGATAHTVDVTGKSERDMDRIEMALERRIDWTRFHVEGPLGYFPPSPEPTP